MFHLIEMGKVLLIFIKNPELGKVKTRLAESIGEDNALKVYRELLKKTISVAGKTDVRRQVWYSSYIDYEDGIASELFEKYLQTGSDLGQKMRNAFQLVFEEGADRAVIIGSDCPSLNEKMIESAFDRLEENDLVIGPSEDGGYYLLGMNRLFETLFEDIEWSTERVLRQTLEKSEIMMLRVASLPELNDIDNLEDLNNAGWDDTTSN